MSREGLLNDGCSAVGVFRQDYRIYKIGDFSREDKGEKGRKRDYFNLDFEMNSRLKDFPTDQREEPLFFSDCVRR